MRFVVVGSGALGSIYAAHLTRGGHDVALVSRGSRADELSEHGVSVTGQDTFTVQCEIVTDPSALTGADALILAVKTYDTTAAVAPLGHMSVGCVLSVQNGVAKNEQLAAVFGREAVVGAASKVSGEVLSPEGDGLPAPVLLTIAGETVVGELGGGTSARVDAVVDALAGSGLAAASSEVIDSVEWSKLVVWSGAVLAAVTRLPLAQCFSDHGTARLAARVVRESGAVAAQLGVGLQDDPPLPAQTMVTGSEDEATEMVLTLGKTLRQAAPDMRPSILQDADRGQRLEVDETLGHTLKHAAEHRVDVPTLDMCYSVLAAVSHVATAARP